MSLAPASGQRVPVRTVVGGGRDTHDGHENSPILVFFSNLLDLSQVTTKMDDALPFCLLASMLRRRANKRPCPCGSGRRLGRCHNRKVNALRDRVGRVFLQREMVMIVRALRKASSQKNATPAPSRTQDWRRTLWDVVEAPTLPAWTLPVRSPACREAGLTPFTVVSLSMSPEFPPPRVATWRATCLA